MNSRLGTCDYGVYLRGHPEVAARMKPAQAGFVAERPQARFQPTAN